LEDAAKGVEKEIVVPRTERCEVCGGSGAAPGSSPRVCSRCNGAGKVQHMRKSSFAMYVQVTACPECRGKGVLVDSPCGSCRGSGLVKKRRKISVKVPAGIDEGYQLRLRGEGEMAANGGVAGDLYVIVHVRSSEVFARDGDDLWYLLMVGFPQAALGAEVSVPTLEGPVTVKVSAGTQPGAVIRVKGKGMPRFRGYGKGDLLVRVGVVVPERLSSRQRELLEELAGEFGEDVRRKGKFRF